MRLLMFFVFSKYGLACKHGTIFQITIYNWKENCFETRLIFFLNIDRNLLSN